ncbi:cytochrome P450 4C1-like [Cimex lectularius]|uniref:Cytochrome P450 n=1 Tax=Cimex lectularius TaxID=79782 RepID=A0A8I6SIL4_CIMLE|nr:cytochrome P450 4C1-like [Cimex lectularius]XP_024081943.1 cytochrome P450 4C1-like [Cimex lectularius]
MEVLPVLLTLSVVGLLTAYLAIRMSSYCKKGSKLPGINSFMSFDLVLKLWISKEDMFSVVKDVLIKTKNLNKDLVAFWLGPVLLVEIKNHDDLEQILTSQECLTKSIQYEFLHNWLGTGLLTSTGALWHSRRKLLMPTFHFKILEQYISIFNENLEILIGKLKSKVKQGFFDIEEFITTYSLDVIAETAMSIKINAQKESTPFTLAIKSITNSLFIRGLTIFYYLDSIYKWSPTAKSEKNSINVIFNTINSLIATKEKSVTVVNDFSTNEFGEKQRIGFIDMLLLAKSKGDIDLKGVKDEVNTFVFEGHDTTSSAMNFGLYLLSKHPEVQEKIYAEIKEVLGEKTVLDHNDLKHLKYLERVIKEILRLYPSAPLIGRSLQKDFKLKSGHVLPAGTTIVIFLYHLHRNEEVFPEPEKFDPDRFLPENCVKMHPYSYLPFSAGFRNCIGQKFAMLEVKIVLAGIISNFKILPSNQEIKEFTSVVLRSAEGINISLEERIVKEP